MGIFVSPLVSQDVRSLTQDVGSPGIGRVQQRKFLLYKNFRGLAVEFAPVEPI